MITNEISKYINLLASYRHTKIKCILLKRVTQKISLNAFVRFKLLPLECSTDIRWWLNQKKVLRVLEFYSKKSVRSVQSGCRKMYEKYLETVKAAGISVDTHCFCEAKSLGWPSKSVETTNHVQQTYLQSPGILICWLAVSWMCHR
jgi:hypothetical protein